LKITFILPGIGISGGIKAVFEFANHLQTRGHDVFVVYPLLPLGMNANWYNPRYLAGKTLSIAGSLRNSVRVDWFNLKAKLLRVPIISDQFIPDADVVVATWWETAYSVNRLRREKGDKFYLIQHYEIWGGPRAKVENTYRLGLRNIANSTWLMNILRNELNAPVEALILHAPDHEQFYPERTKPKNAVVRILLPYRHEDWKGTADGITAFEIARKTHSNTQLVMFGPKPGKDLPRYAEFHERPYGDRLRRIYNSCDIFVFPSHVEGFGMPPMEAMACKCAVVSTSVGAIPEYSIAGETALLSPPHSPESLAENITRLLADAALRTHIAEAGCNHIKNFTWDKATDALEQVFKKALSEVEQE
jgi:glycosyltransferase involved in cell wall biosynthesis